MFGAFEEKDGVSILELKRGFNRIPGLKSRDTLKLARYLVESTESVTVLFDDYAECSVKQAKERLGTLFEAYQLPSPQDEERLKRGVVEKLGPYVSSVREALQSLEKSSGVVDALAIGEMANMLKFPLTTEEIDYCVLLMHKASKDVQRLPYQPLVSLLEESARKATLSDHDLDLDAELDEPPDADPGAAIPAPFEGINHK